MEIRRILYVDTGRSFGGAERITRTLAAAFAEAGREVGCVVHPGAARFRSEVERAGAVAFPIPEADRLSRMAPLVRGIRDFRPDLVHIHRTWPLSDRYAAVAARRAGATRVVATEHVRWERCGRRDRLAKRFLARFDVSIVAVSEAVRESLLGYWKLPRSLVTVVENGIDAARFCGEEEVPAGTFPSSWTARIGAVGRLEEQKGYDVLIDAMALVRDRVPGAGLLIAGEGSLRDDLETRVQERGLLGAVRFAGALESVAPLLRSLDVYVLASRWEGLPLTVLEAMAAGTPVVATAVEGTVEAVRHGREGLIVPVGDPEALADGIVKALDDREGAAVRAGAARRRVEDRYSVSRMVEEYARVYGP